MKTLEELCKIPAISGFEKKGLEYFKEIFIKNGFTDVKADIYGNIFAEKKSKSKDAVNLLIDAHIDEIGLIVKEVKENGFILFDTVGGIDYDNLYCREVTIFGKKEIYGVIGAIPPHLKKDNEKEKLYIDTGLKNAEAFINIGDCIKIKSDFLKLQNNHVSSGALDNRAGLLCAIMCAKKMREDVNVTVVGSVREESGLYGIDLFLKDKSFDCAIVLDVTHGYFEGLTKYNSYIPGDGFTICYGGILDNRITNEIEKYLIKNEIKYNIEFEPDHPGTNAFNIVTNNIPVIMLSLPTKYMHTTCETVNTKDIKSLIKFISTYNWNTLKKEDKQNA